MRPCSFEYLVYEPGHRTAVEPRCRADEVLRCSGVALRGNGSDADRRDDLLRRTAQIGPAKPGRGSSSRPEYFFESSSIRTIASFIVTKRICRKNLVGFAFYDFHTPLIEWQLAPPGFLAVERLMILLPLPFAARGQAGSVRLLDRLDVPDAGRSRAVISHAAAVPIAVGLFALTDWMLYYSVEIKQYSSDVALDA